MSRRRKADERWSATFSMNHIDRADTTGLDPDLDDEALTELLAGRTGRVQFRFRFNGRNKNPSVPLAAGTDEVLAFRHRLRVAIADDWDLGHDNIPVPPTSSATRAAPPGPAADTPSNVLEFPDRRPSRQPTAADTAGDGNPTAKAGRTVGLFDPDRARFADLAEPDPPLDTFGDLVAWRLDELATTNAQHKSRKRRGNTLGNAETELRFAAGYFRMPGPGGPSCTVRGDGTIDADDCIDFGTYRKHTNLQMRSANEKQLRRWAADTERAERRGDPVPAAPVLGEEVAVKRTIQATMKQVGAAFASAFVEERIATNPWNTRVEKRIEAPPRTHFTERALPSQSEVRLIEDTLATRTRSAIVDGKLTEVDGERYRALVRLAEDRHARPEELRAIRDSDVVLEHPTMEPHIALCEARPMVPSRHSADGRSYEVIELKAREEGDIRYLWLGDRPDVVDVLRVHRLHFVADPDPGSDEPDRRDLLLFTTHNGNLVDPSNFNLNWWRPTMEVLSDELPICAELKFRHLRHTGITRRFLAGNPTDVVAEEAGNTPEVIRSSYRGIVAAVDHATRAGRRPQVVRTDPLAALFAEDMSIDAVVDWAGRAGDEDRDRARRKLNVLRRVLDDA